MADLVDLCQVFNCLPSPGGLLDQDGQTIVKMQSVMIAREAERKRQRDLEEQKTKALRGRKRK